MSGPLFGELELGKSFGISKSIKLRFAKPRTLLYASGNCLNAVDLNNTKEYKSEGNNNNPPSEKSEGEIRVTGICHGEAHSKVLSGDEAITAFAMLGKENIIAYCERYSPCIKIVRWSPTTGVVSPIAKLSTTTSDISIVSLAFSADGLYLASLGDLPEHQVSVWDWRVQKLVASCSNGNPAKSISFNPADSKQLCTSGGVSGKISFWKIKVGFKKCSLIKTVGSNSFTSNSNTIVMNPWQTEASYEPEAADLGADPRDHLWIPDKNLLCISEKGDKIFKYRAENGSFELFYDAKDMSYQISSVLQNTKNVIIGCTDGMLRILNLQGDYLKSYKIGEEESIYSMEPSVDYQKLLVETGNGRYYLCDIRKQQSILIKIENISGLVDMSILPSEKTLITLHSSGLIKFSNVEKNTKLQKVNFNVKGSSIAASPASSLVAVGSSSGVVRIYNAKEISYNVPKLLFRKRIHSKEVSSLLIDPSGKLMASSANDGYIFLYDLEKLAVIGFFKLAGVIRSMRFEYCDDPAKEGSRLYVLRSDPLGSSILTFEIPEKEKIAMVENSLQIQKTAYGNHEFCYDGELIDFCVAPKQTLASKSIFYTISTDTTLRVFTTPTNLVGDVTNLTNQLYCYKDHSKLPIQMSTSLSGEWIRTCGSDGLITIRSVIEPDKGIKFMAHDPLSNGAFGCAFSTDYRYFISVGNDGLCRRWDWKYSVTGRRAAAEVAESIERQIAEQAIQFAELDALPTIEDSPDDAPDEASLAPIESSQDENSTVLSNEKEIHRHHIQAKLNEITQKMLELMKRNENAPELEKIDRAEFVIDLKEKERLVQETDNEIAQIRKEQERKNLEKRVLKSRIKKECWDSAEVIGQSIKSFKDNQMLGKPLEVTNYTIRRKTPAEIQKISNIKRLRRVQLAVNQALNKNKDSDKSNENPEETVEKTDDKKFKVPESANSKLLYHPFELNTKEKRRIQVYLLAEIIDDIKLAFNQTFSDMVKSKQDEIGKIEEKNERIVSILQQLQLNEKIYHPELDEDEIPESVIKVADSEVKAEKFLNAEELAKLEAKRLAAEERLRLQGEDNYRERALMQMMGGKLEDRKAQEETEEVVRPEWMNKAKEEMTDEEKKLLKEFEKKMAIFKEEQEKHRKALETELRKLQGAISEIQDGFDQKLLEYSQIKQKNDSAIYERELSMIKQNHYAIMAGENEIIEAQLVNRIEQLKLDKINCTNEIPEIKKELERCREEYESALRREKEIDKLFKKEFHSNEFFYETVSKLYKKRSPVVSTEKDPNEEDLNPFSFAEKEAIQFETSPPPLNQSADMPEGLGQDLWNKLVDLRDKKINAELEVYTTGRYFKEMQQLVQNVLEESDFIKTEMERVTSDLNQFLEFKFKTIHDIESLSELKQGQVEVPQAPIVTNYTDAVLVHRSVVENINEQVRHLGKLKVDALTEMKEYRKGIHALEWENKMQDFQAEDLIIRSRDIQLLRVTKEMQEYLRSGDFHKQASEVSNLEKVSEHSQKVHQHQLEERWNNIKKLKIKKSKKDQENKTLEAQINDLRLAVQERYKVQESKHSKPSKDKNDTHRELVTRRRLVDLAKSQAQDIAILREELERLRLRTYPAFRA